MLVLLDQEKMRLLFTSLFFNEIASLADYQDNTVTVLTNRLDGSSLTGDFLIVMELQDGVTKLQSTERCLGKQVT